jgi:hypothetical protein
MTKASALSNNKKGSVSKATTPRRQHAVRSLESFAQRRGEVRALEEFHKRKELKRSETSKALRKYRKVMKQEGYEAGTGASRKRLEKTDDEKITIEEEKKTEENNQQTPHNKRQKSNPFKKSLEKAKQNKIHAQDHKERQEANEKERQKRLQERKKQSKLMAKRTKKGQPIMKHMIDNILTKLTKGTNA